MGGETHITAEDYINSTTMPVEDEHNPNNYPFDEGAQEISNFDPRDQ